MHAILKMRELSAPKTLNDVSCDLALNMMSPGYFTLHLDPFNWNYDLGIQLSDGDIAQKSDAASSTVCPMLSS